MMNNPSSKINPKLLGLIPLVLIIAISILFLAFRTDLQDDPIPTYDFSEIVRIQSQLTKIAGNSNDIAVQENLLRDLQMAELDATRYAAVTPQPKDLVPTPPGSDVQPTRMFPTGIFNHGSSAYKPSQVTITSSWQGIIEGIYYQIEVGALASDPSQGVVYYMVTTPSNKIIDMGRTFTPIKEGAVTVINEQSGRLTLKTQKGSILYYSAQAKSFYRSSKEVLPSPTTPMSEFSPILGAVSS